MKIRELYKYATLMAIIVIFFNLLGLFQKFVGFNRKTVDFGYFIDNGGGTFRGWYLGIGNREKYCGIQLVVQTFINYCSFDPHD